MRTLTMLTAVMVVCLFCAPILAQENSLVLWSHWKSDPIKVNFLNAVAEEFKKSTGISVNIVWMEKNDLMEKLIAAIDTPEPDIAYIDSGFTHPRIVRSLADLSDLKTTATLDPSWSFGSVGDGKNNFLPFEGASSAMYYNKPLFEKAGITLPQDRPLNEQEFVELIAKLRAAGITPIGEGTADRPWKAGLPILYTIFRIGGAEKLAQLLKEEVNFSDPDVTAALTLWKKVIDAQGYDGQKAIQLGLNDGIYEVTDGRAGINFCGTWIYSKFGATERDKGQVGVLDWFTVANGKGNDLYELAWVAGYGINKNSKQIENAKKFLEFLLTPTAASLYVKYVQGPYPVLTGELPKDSLYGALANLRTGKKSVNLIFHFLNFASKAANNMWAEETQKFIAGQESVEEFISRMNSRMK